MTLIEKIQKKAEIIARRHKDDIDFISTFTSDDEEDIYFGSILIEVNEWGGPKMKNGKIVGDHTDFFAVSELETWLKPLGASLHFESTANDIENHVIHTYRVIFK